MMLHAKFQDHLASGSEEKDVYYNKKCFTICWPGGHIDHDLDRLYKLSFPLPKEAPHGIWF